MTILNEKKQKDIFESWEKWRAWRDDGKRIKGVPPFFQPITKKIDAMPVTKGADDFHCKSSSCNYLLGSIFLNRDINLNFVCPACKMEQIYRGERSAERKDTLKKYQEKIEEKIKNHKKIPGFCYLYVSFRKYDNISFQSTSHTFKKYDNDSFPDVDNFLKLFFDIIKGILLADDRYIIGVKANTVRVSDLAKQGVSFTLIPAYDLKIDKVVDIKEKADMDILNELRKKYSEKYSDGKIGKPWIHPMQMITTKQGIFFDTAVGKLWGVERYREEKQYDYKPELGFDWNKNKKNDKSNTIADGTRGIMIFQRSYCWWINKWENK